MPKKRKEDKDYYIKEIEVIDWLKSNDSQKIRFNDRVEYKENNKLHREDGPAIEYFDNIGNQFYVEGNKLSDEEWQNFRRTKLIDRML